MAWMASEPDSITPRVALARERTRLACMSCPNISLMWLRIRSWLNMAIICRVLAGQGWRSYLRSRATPRSYEGMVKPSDTSTCCPLATNRTLVSMTARIICRLLGNFFLTLHRSQGAASNISHFVAEEVFRPIFNFAKHIQA